MIQSFGFANNFLHSRYCFQSSAPVTKHEVKPGEDGKKRRKKVNEEQCFKATSQQWSGYTEWLTLACGCKYLQKCEVNNTNPIPATALKL